ncbi:MAG: hypothetical protein O7G29_13510, partial [Acidobacteria bacterium]|nr:hypothetical protein [Acidobacteriota bacterium]
MANDFRFWREKKTLNSAQDPSWFFGQTVKSVQHTTTEEVPGETALKEQAAEATAQKEELEARFREWKQQEEEAKRESGVLSLAPLVPPASQGGGLDFSQDPNWFFDELVKPVHHTAEKENPGEEEQDLLAEGKEEHKTEEQAARGAEANRKVEEQAAKEVQQQEARELVEKAMALGGTEEAIEVYDEVISRIQEAKETALKKQVAEVTAKKEALETGLRELTEQKEQAAREAEEKHNTEEQAAREAEEKRKAEEQAAREAEEKLRVEEQATTQAQEKRKTEEQATREAEEKHQTEEQAVREAQEKHQTEEQAAREAQEKHKAEERAIREAEEKLRVEVQATQEAQERR